MCNQRYLYLRSFIKANLVLFEDLNRGNNFSTGNFDPILAEEREGKYLLMVMISLSNIQIPKKYPTRTLLGTYNQQ